MISLKLWGRFYWEPHWVLQLPYWFLQLSFCLCSPVLSLGTLGDDPMKVDLDRMNVVNIQPGDVIALMHPKRLSMKIQERLKASMGKLFPDNKIVIIEEGMTMDVYRPPLNFNHCDRDPITGIFCYRCNTVFRIEADESVNENLCPKCVALKESGHAQGT